MTEREYILATDIRSLDIATEALRHVIPANNERIPQDEYADVMRKLDAWRTKCHATIRVR